MDLDLINWLLEQEKLKADKKRIREIAKNVEIKPDIQNQELYRP